LADGEAKAAGTISLNARILMPWSKGDLAMLTANDSSAAVNAMASCEEIDAAGVGHAPVRTGGASVAPCGVSYREKNIKGQEVR